MENGSRQLCLDEQRDMVLERHRHQRRMLIHIAEGIALELARAHGSVSSPEVLREMRARGWGPHLADIDGRFMGAVMLPSRGWRRTGELDRTGSRARPVPRWERAT